MKGWGIGPGWRGGSPAGRLPTPGELGTIEGSIGEVRAQLKGDQVRLESLLRTYRRSQELLKVHLSSKEELDKLEGEIAQLKGKIEAEKRRLPGWRPPAGHIGQI